MAKLSKNKKVAQQQNDFMTVDDMPPPARPKEDAVPSSDAPTPASNRKRKRQRGRKSGQAASFSDNASNGAVDPISSSMMPSSRPASTQVTRPTVESLKENPTPEERSVYGKEPEMFGIYAASSDDERDAKKIKSSEDSNVFSESVEPVEVEPGGDERVEETVRIEQKAVTEQLTNGQFTCPFKDQFNCAQIFASRNSAMRHGNDIHMSSDQFKCLECDMGFTRRDKYDRHMKSHGSDVLSRKPAKKAKKAATAVEDEVVEDLKVPAEVDRIPETPEPEVQHEASDDSETEESKEATSNTTPSADEVYVEPDKVQIDEETTGDEEEEEVSDMIGVNGQQQSDIESQAVREEENSSDGSTEASDTEAAAEKKPMESVSQSEEEQQAPQKSVKRKRTAPSLALNPTTSRPRKRARTGTPREDSDRSENEDDVLVNQQQTRKGRQTTRKEKVVPGPQPAKAESTKPVNEHADEEDDSDQDTQTSKLAHRPKGVASKSRPARKSPVLDMQRQSSMDSFVSRERTSTGNAKASTSRVNARPDNVRPARKQTKLASGEKASHPSKPASRKGKERAFGDEEESSDQEQIKRPKPPTKKRKQSQRTKHEAADADDSAAEGIGKPRTRVRKRLHGDTAGPKEGETGRFTEDEITTLYSWRDSFCAEHDMSHSEFNNLVTASLRRDKLSWPYKFIDKKQFLQQYYEQLPNRNRRSMVRFRERHFQNVTDAKWTAQDDEELKTLVRDLGTKWVDIGQMMDRTADQVSQRWRHKLNYGQDVSTGEWSPEDILKLETEVESFAKSKDKSVDDESLAIPWHAISVKIGNGRTPQQCSNRWRVSTTRRIGGVFVRIGTEDRDAKKAVKPVKPPKTIKTPNKTARRLEGDDGGDKKQTRSKAKKLEPEVQAQSTPKAKTRSRVKQKTPKKPAQKSLSAERVMDSSDEADDESEPRKSPSAGSKQDVHTSKDTAGDSEENAAQSDYNDDDNEQDQDVEDQPTQSEQEQPEGEVEDESQSERSPSPVKSSPPKPRPSSQIIPSPSNYPTQSTQPILSQLKASKSSQLPSSPPRKTRSSQLKSSQPLPKFTPAQSRNPLKSKQTPNDNLTQLLAATQATSPQNTTGKKSRVPASVLEERPSPGNSIRRQPVSSPLGLIGPYEGSDEEKVDGSGSGDEDESDDRESETQSTSERNSQDGDDDGPEAEDEDDEGDDKEEAKQPPKSSGFFDSIKGIFGRSSQATPAQTRRKKLDLTQRVVDSDSDA